MPKAIGRENFGNVLVAELEAAGQTADLGHERLRHADRQPLDAGLSRSEAFLKAPVRQAGPGRRRPVQWGGVAPTRQATDPLPTANTIKPRKGLLCLPLPG